MIWFTALHGAPGEVRVAALGLQKAVLDKLEANQGIHATLINPRCFCALDEKTLNALPEYGRRLVVTLEDGVLDDGLGETIAGFYGNSDMKVLPFARRRSLQTVFRR